MYKHINDKLLGIAVTKKYLECFLTSPVEKLIVQRILDKRVFQSVCVSANICLCECE